MQSDPKAKVETPDIVEARRRFLATCGKFSVATPPAIALLLATAERNYAVAQSGAGNTQTGGDWAHSNNRTTTTGTTTASTKTNSHH